MPPTMIAPSSNQPNYDFIINPAKPASKLSFRVMKSKPLRLAMVAAVAVVFLIIFVVAKSLLGGGVSNIAALTSVVQYQQALTHISTAAELQTGASATTLNSAATIQASVSSADQQLLAYFKSNGQSISKTVANQKISTATDALLKAAAASGTYDTTYRTTMQTLLSAYEQALKQAYAVTTGSKGQALLNSEYSDAQLLLKQLN